MIEVGKPAPDFTLPDQRGEMITLSALRGAPVVLYFYPKDDTPGCTAEACGFRDARAEYEEVDARVLGVSPDSIATHLKFSDKHALPFTLLADSDCRVCELYGVWKERSMYGKKSMGVERTTLIIDRDGIVRKVYPKVKVDGHVQAVLATLRTI
ncbi:MAG: thioredoxin-dependent thiol peroxidase [Planctomycetaceae bacterium]|nr:thioredoxin-dependent thiol peroxidase [Planctomycetaceae bacterium]